MEKYRLSRRWSYPQRAKTPPMLLHLDSYQNPAISWTCCDISFVLLPYWACSNSSMILHCDFSCAMSVCHSALVPQSRNGLKSSIIPVFFSAFCPSRPLFFAYLAALPFVRFSAFQTRPLLVFIDFPGFASLFRLFICCSPSPNIAVYMFRSK